MNNANRDGWLNTGSRHCRAILAFSAIAWLVAADHLSAQATAYSSAIRAEAQYMRGQGEFLKAAAEARKGNAEAASMEMDNAVKWVKTYFERRRINREERAEEFESMLDFKEKQYARQRRLQVVNPQAVLEYSDVTDDLNWMLRDLLVHSPYSMFLPGDPRSLLSSPDNALLTKDDVHHIRLAEKGAAGKSVKFRADTAQVLETRWPPALRDERFDVARHGFESARNAAISDLKRNQELSRDSEKQLMAAVDTLSSELATAYPRSQQLVSPTVFLDYLAAKRYLQSLAVSSYYLIESQSQAAFDESYRFGGGSVGELLQHMMNRSLEFASPEPGDEPMYRRLYTHVRTLYLQVVPE